MSALKQITAHDFLGLGLNEVGYIRAMKNAAQTVYGLYAANGQLLGVQDSARTAFNMALNNNITPITVH